MGLCNAKIAFDWKENGSRYRRRVGELASGEQIEQDGKQAGECVCVCLYGTWRRCKSFVQKRTKENWVIYVMVRDVFIHSEAFSHLPSNSLAIDGWSTAKKRHTNKTIDLPEQQQQQQLWRWRQFVRTWAETDKRNGYGAIFSRYDCDSSDDL